MNRHRGAQEQDEVLPRRAFVGDRRELVRAAQGPVVTGCLHYTQEVEEDIFAPICASLCNFASPVGKEISVAKETVGKNP